MRQQRAQTARSNPPSTANAVDVEVADLNIPDGTDISMTIWDGNGDVIITYSRDYGTHPVA